ncbi:ATP-binding protein [Bacillus massiliigorillae]|uniref:ATP-binding protein n=1 Tax=Bacillus massiliigorillae TaxID=1243664 RepID=UPI0003A85B48|nr:ATP-binding protein [Bacillus massiliigorillae]
MIVEVKDSGIGIPETEIPYVINRFYRVDKARSRKNGGNGLGLPIAHRLLNFYNGALKIESKNGEWTKVTITIPLIEKVFINV